MNEVLNPQGHASWAVKPDSNCKMGIYVRHCHLLQHAHWLCHPRTHAESTVFLALTLVMSLSFFPYCGHRHAAWRYDPVHPQNPISQAQTLRPQGESVRWVYAPCPSVAWEAMMLNCTRHTGRALKQSSKSISSSSGDSSLSSITVKVSTSGDAPCNAFLWIRDEVTRT